MVWGYIGLNDVVKVSKRGARTDAGKISKVHQTNHVTVKYADGTTAVVRTGDVQKTSEQNC